MTKTFQWFLDPPRSLASAEDEFPVRGVRLRLWPGTLEVEAATDCPEEPARRLADEYVTLLRGQGVAVFLRTEADFVKHTPLVVQAEVASRRDGPSFVRRAMRRARNAFLSGSDSTLIRCYEYRDQMIDDPARSLFYAYKLIESLEHRFGGEDDLIKTLRMRSAIKYVKRVANESCRDERHAPTDASERMTLTPDERAKAIADTHKILRAYEHWLQPEP